MESPSCFPVRVKQVNFKRFDYCDKDIIVDRFTLFSGDHGGMLIIDEAPIKRNDVSTNLFTIHC